MTKEESSHEEQKPGDGEKAGGMKKRVRMNCGLRDPTKNVREQDQTRHGRNRSSPGRRRKEITAVSKWESDTYRGRY